MAAKPTAHRRADGTISYKVRFRTAPGTNPTSETFSTLAGATDFARLVDSIGGEAAREMRHASDTAGTQVPTLSTYFETHLERLAAHATPGTIDDYRRMATRTWLRPLGKLPLTAISRDQVTRWVAAQRQTETIRSAKARAKAQRESLPLPPVVTYAPKSIANAQRLLSEVLSGAVEDGHIPRNPAKGVRLPSDHERAERVFITNDEYTAIYACVDEHWQPLVALLFGTGMRWGEATALAVSDLDLDDHVGVVTVRRAWKKGADNQVYLGSPKSRRALRTITINRSLTTLIRSHVAGRATDGLVFTSAAGQRVRSQNFYSRVWRPAVSASGIAKRPDLHSLRHSHVALLARQGIPVTTVQRRLGHESITTTIDTYGHLYPDADMQAAEALEVAMAGSLPEIEGEGHEAGLA